MFANMNQLFANMENVKPNAGGVYFKAPGLYLAKIQTVKTDQAQAGFPYFLVEFELVESNHPELPIGTTVSWMASMKNAQHIQTFQANVKGFVLAALQGKDPSVKSEQINASVVSYVCAEAQPLTGYIVRAQASDITTKGGDPFTKVVYQPYTAPGAPAVA